MTWGRCSACFASGPCSIPIRSPHGRAICGAPSQRIIATYSSLFIITKPLGRGLPGTKQHEHSFLHSTGNDFSPGADLYHRTRLGLALGEGHPSVRGQRGGALPSRQRLAADASPLPAESIDPLPTATLYY